MYLLTDKCNELGFLKECIKKKNWKEGLRQKQTKHIITSLGGEIETITVVVVQSLSCV